MKITTLFVTLAVLIASGQLIGQQLSSNLIASDSAGQEFVGLFSWALPTLGFLAMLGVGGFRSRLQTVKSVATKPA